MTTRFLGSAGLASALLALGLCAGTARAEDPRPDGIAPAHGLPRAEIKPADRTTAGANDAWLVYDRPGLRYEQPRFTGDARLFVREKNDAHATHKADTTDTTDTADTAAGNGWRVYRGRDLDAIAKANSDLLPQADMVGLRQYLTTNTKTPAASMRVAGAVRTSVEGPGFVYEPAPQGTARLFVRDADGREMMHTGSDLASIVRDNPSLEQVAGFSDFHSRAILVDAVRPWTLRRDSATIMNVSYQPTGVVVESNQWRDGRWQTQTHKGRTLEEIETAQPTLRAMFDGAADVAPSSAPEGLNAPASQVESFGATMATPPRCLDTQLNLGGSGILVTKVVSGSSAEKLGLRADDVIVDYDGRAVTDREWVQSQFASWRADSRANVIVLRRGARVPLSR